jgi:cyclophilin family peptidyl-prolyl cis-trans isomerase
MRIAVLLLVVAVAAGCIQSSPPPGPTPTVTYDAIHFDTDAGPITVVLYNESAPQTVALMKAYVGEGYYVGRSFGRIVPGHVIQVADASGGASDDGRHVPLETSLRLHFSAGAAGIARSQDPNSGGPEIFLMDFATSHLDGNYTVWGQVVAGLDVVHRIARGPAFDFRSLPSELAPAAPTDRMALQPTLIRHTSMVRILQAPGELPMQVAKNKRSGDLRHSLEWQPDLWSGDGNPHTLTWYTRTYNGTAAPDPGRVHVRIDGQDLAVTGEPETPGVYHFEWTPPDRTAHSATFVSDGAAPATLVIRPG